MKNISIKQRLKNNNTYITGIPLGKHYHIFIEGLGDNGQPIICNNFDITKIKQILIEVTKSNGLTILSIPNIDIDTPLKDLIRIIKRGLKNVR